MEIGFEGFCAFYLNLLLREYTFDYDGYAFDLSTYNSIYECKILLN